MDARYMKIFPRGKQLLFDYIHWFFLGVAFAFAYFPVLRSLFDMWSNSEDHSHGFVIVPLSLYVVWQKKEKLNNIEILPNLWGGVLVVLALFMYLFAAFADIKTLAAYSLLPLVAGVVIYLFGFRIFRECLFSIAFLVFMMPIPEQIYTSLTNPLQIIVSVCSVWFASLADIPIYRSGNVIQLPDRTLQVVAACSGLRSLTTILTLASIFGYLSLKGNLLRGLLLISSVPTAILVNIIRVFAMIIAFYYFNFDLTIGTVHTVFGLVIFLLALKIVAMTKGVLSLWDK